MEKLRFNSFKNRWKKCVKCGKEEDMTKNQLRCSECIHKERKRVYNNTHCGECGRYSQHGLYDYGKIKICSFCMNRKVRERIAKKEGVSTQKYCSSCGYRVWDSTALKYQIDGKIYCKACFEIKKWLGVD